ncbi:MAG: 6-pyruvoyl tetrahydropterin synthase family protein [Gemmatimonadota bacterium]|nr:6-pyruvoyl tetrahydropterin synthase family protein [Gemmatimonadota bacterium]
MPRSGSYRVEVTKDYLVFASAHFITFEGHRCEPLHGHNYRVRVALEGTTDEESWYVFDFGRLKKMMRRLCDAIDHRMLVPTKNPRLTIGQMEATLTIALDGKPRYVFPLEDCVLLPIANTTVEMLARHLAGQVRAELTAVDLAHLSAIEVEVEENFGQNATYFESLAEPGEGS